jgi:hypothetical protein
MRRLPLMLPSLLSAYVLLRAVDPRILDGTVPRGASSEVISSLLAAGRAQGEWKVAAMTGCPNGHYRNCGILSGKLLKSGRGRRNKLARSNRAA